MKIKGDMVESLGLCEGCYELRRSDGEYVIVRKDPDLEGHFLFYWYAHQLDENGKPISSSDAVHYGWTSNVAHASTYTLDDARNRAIDLMNLYPWGRDIVATPRHKLDENGMNSTLPSWREDFFYIAVKSDNGIFTYCFEDDRHESCEVHQFETAEQWTNEWMAHRNQGGIKILGLNETVFDPHNRIARPAGLAYRIQGIREKRS